MSWQLYITNLMKADEHGSNPIQEAAICGFACGAESVWASSPGLANMTAEEIKKLAGDSSCMRECGPKVAGKKCMLLTDDTGNVQSYCLNLKASKSDGGGNICVGKAGTALVVALGKEGASGGNLVTRVYPIVKYLKDLNY